MTLSRKTETDKTPGQIEVWVCPTCGYWRQERSTGIHQYFPAQGRQGRGERHELVKAAYIYLGESE